MQLGANFVSAGKPGLFRGARRPDYSSQPAVWLACFLIFLLTTPCPAQGGDWLQGIPWRNVEFTTYARGTGREIATCKVEKVFTDHRKLGFFRVRLLPVLVIQGVRLKLAAPDTGADWTHGFQPDWLPGVNSDAVEWRDVSVVFEATNAPVLRAERAFPSPGVGATVCKFKNVTVQVRGQTWHVPEADLRNENGQPCAIWSDGGGERRLDLLNGEISETHQ